MKFNVNIVRGNKRPFDRQIWDGVEILGAKVDILMNSKLDHYQPAVCRVVVTNAVRNIHKTHTMHVCHFNSVLFQSVLFIKALDLFIYQNIYLSRCSFSKVMFKKKMFHFVP